MAIAESSGDHDLLGFAIRSRLRGWFDPDAVAGRRAMARRLVELGTATGDRSLEGWGHTWESIELLEEGDRARFVEALDRASEIVDELRDPFRRWQIDARQVCLHILDGDLARAEAAASDYLAAYSQAHFAPFVMAAWGMQLVVVRFLQGRIDEMAWALQMGTFRGGRPMVWLWADPERCRAELDALLPELDDLLRPELGRTTNLTVLVVAAHAVGHQEAGRLLQPRVEAHLDSTTVVPPCVASLGAMRLTTGLLAELAGDLPAAITHLSEAVARNERAENRPFAVVARQHLGRVLCRAGDAEGPSVLAAANDDAQGLGITTDWPAP
jgi:hypothetical protein